MAPRSYPWVALDRRRWHRRLDRLWAPPRDLDRAAPRQPRAPPSRGHRASEPQGLDQARLALLNRAMGIGFAKPELVHLDELEVGAKPLGMLSSLVERFERIIHWVLEPAANLIRRRPLGRDSARVPDPASQLARRNQLALGCAGSRRDALVDQRPAQVIGAG